MFHGLIAPSMNNRRRDLTQRGEDEKTLSEPGVRNLEVGLIELDVAEQQNVEIERARTVGNAGRTVAPELLLDGQQCVEQIAGFKIGLEFDNGIHKSRLIGESHWACTVNRRSAGDAAERSEPLRCRRQRCLRRSSQARQVRAHRDVGSPHDFNPTRSSRSDRT